MKTTTTIRALSKATPGGSSTLRYATLIPSILPRSTYPLPAADSHRRYYAAPAIVENPEIDTLSPRQPDYPLTESRLDAIRRLLEDDLGGADQWLDRIDTAQHDLRRGRKGVVAVYGSSLAEHRNLVSALVRDPLGETIQSRQAVLERYKDASSDVLVVQYAENSARRVDELDTPSPWLQHLGYDLEEINLHQEEDVITRMLRADIAIIALDPVHLLEAPTMAQIVANLAYKESLVLVVNGKLPYSSSEDVIRQQLLEQYSSLSPDTPPPIIVFTQASQGLDALDSLDRALHQGGIADRVDPVERFQEGFQASNVGGLQKAILSVGMVLENGGPESTSNRTAEAALAHVEKVISDDRHANQAAQQVVEQLVQLASRTASDAKHLSVISRGIEGGLVEGGVKHALSTARGEIDALLVDRWSWINLVFKARADVVGSELSRHLDQTFGREMEKQLIFETGQMAQLQKSLSTRTDDTLKRLANPRALPHPLSSPVLINHLSTLTLSIPEYEATTLLLPIVTRRRQLIQKAVPRLQLSAQRNLLSTLGFGGLGVAASWASYVAPLSLVSGVTACGCGLLSIVTGLALGQRWWTRAQRNFWRDWERITGMLRGDLQTVLDETIQTNLLAKPLAAADGLEDIIRRRGKRIDDIVARAKLLRQK